MILTWTWESPFENIQIYDNEKLIGAIVDFDSKTVNQICQDKIVIESQGFGGQHIYFTDPRDNKAYCKYNFENIVSEKRACEIIDGTLYEVIKGEFKNDYKKIIELKVKRKFFKDFKNSGELIVHENAKLGIDIFTVFFDYNFKRNTT
jgi:hypothetical protein